MTYLMIMNDDKSTLTNIFLIFNKELKRQIRHLTLHKIINIWKKNEEKWGRNCSTTNIDIIFINRKMD